MGPYADHEFANRNLAFLVRIASGVAGLDYVSLGHTRLLQKGRRFKEPDAVFYFGEDAAAIRRLLLMRRTVDPSRDPAPHLIIEVDVSSSSSDRDAVYARLGVKELWVLRDRLSILHLDPDEYVERAASLCFPWLTAARLEGALADFADPALPASRAEERFRSWARAQVRKAGRTSTDQTPPL